MSITYDDDDQMTGVRKIAMDYFVADRQEGGSDNNIIIYFMW
jgi:hypothetical protein